MDNLVGATATKLLIDYGALGILIIILIFAVVFLYRQNLKLYADNIAAHEKRVEDAKKFASEHAAAAAQLEATSDNLHELFNVVKDITSRRK
jgi:Tfp pilus assembly protein PilO